MCLVCKEWIKGSITTKEALRNLSEFNWLAKTREESAHYTDVKREIREKDPNGFEEWFDDATRQ